MLETVTLVIPREGKPAARFEVQRRVIEMSLMVRDIIENMEGEDGTGMIDDEIPLPNLTPEIAPFILEYCDAHTNVAVEDKDAWDRQFLQKMTYEEKIAVLHAANFLNVQCLMNLICTWVANEMKGLTTEEIRAKFQIVNDFTPEEEAQIRKENAWAFDFC